jgi:hypothetical protein
MRMPGGWDQAMFDIGNDLFFQGTAKGKRRIYISHKDHGASVI